MTKKDLFTQFVEEHLQEFLDQPPAENRNFESITLLGVFAPKPPGELNQRIMSQALQKVENDVLLEYLLLAFFNDIWFAKGVTVVEKNEVFLRLGLDVRLDAGTRLRFRLKGKEFSVKGIAGTVLKIIFFTKPSAHQCFEFLNTNIARELQIGYNQDLDGSFMFFHGEEIFKMVENSEDQGAAKKDPMLDLI